MPEIIFTSRALPFRLGVRKSGQQEAGENCDDRDDDQQFNERKTFAAWNWAPHAVREHYRY